MSRRRERTNAEWETPSPDFTWEHVKVEVLMDIREELRTLNRLLGCHNCIAIPATPRAIQRNTAKPKRKAKP